MTLEAATLFTLFADGPYFRRLPADTTALTSNDDNLTADYLAAFDVKIKVGEGNDSATFLACSDVLCSRSQYFYASLSNTVITEEDLFFILEKPHIRPDTFEDILRYICTGATNIDQLDASTLFELLKAADELLLLDLVEGIKTVFFRRYQKCQPDSPVTILNEIFQQSLTNDFEDLVRDLIEENPWALYKSPDLHYVSEATMQRLAEHANANGSQGVILDIIIKWGIRKNQQLPMSISQWKRKEFTILKRTIKRVINFLRFTDRVNGYANAALIPFEMIAPTKMVKQLRAAGALPMGPFYPCLQVPNTNLISDELADRLLEQLHGGDGAWLQPSKNGKPLFKTLFASKSKLGISSAHLPPKRTVAYRLLIRCVSKQRTFYTKFDGRGGVIRAPTLILARRENSPQVVGGYAAEGVTNPQQAVRGESKDSFIFSFPSWNVDESTGEVVDDVDEPQWQDRGICRGDIKLDLDGKNITVKPDYYVGKDFIGRPKELDIRFEECEMLEVHKEEIELAVGC